MTAKAEETTTTPTHVCIRPMGGFDFKAGDLIDAALWKRGRTEAYERTRCLERLSVPPERVARDAVARGQKGLADLDQQEKDLKAKVDQIAQNMTELRKKIDRLGKVVIEHEEAVREFEVLQGDDRRVRGLLEALPAQRAAFVEEQHRGESMLRGLGVSA